MKLRGMLLFIRAREPDSCIILLGVRKLQLLQSACSLELLSTTCHGWSERIVVSQLPSPHCLHCRTRHWFGPGEDVYQSYGAPQVDLEEAGDCARIAACPAGGACH